MGQAIGEILPFALGVAISPIPIIAIIVMLLSARAGANSTAFLVGWVVGVAGGCIVLLALSGLLETDEGGATSSSSSTVKLILGALLVMMAARHFRQRPKAGEVPELPKWLQSIDTLTPVKAVGLGVLLSAVNPKNLVLIAGAMVGVAQLGLPAGDEAVAVAVFVVIAVSTVTAPVIVYRTAGARAEHVLGEMKLWLGQNNAVVMAVLLLVIGVVLISKGISGHAA
jgi:threonine/homoserine/homoserine lactone efflux protein